MSLLSRFYPSSSAKVSNTNSGTLPIEVFIVGGGGGGGATINFPRGGGGGGAGQVIYTQFDDVDVGVQYTITVGAGGAGAAATPPSATAGAERGSSGSSSSISKLITAFGGGGGGTAGISTALPDGRGLIFQSSPSLGCSGGNGASPSTMPLPDTSWYESPRKLGINVSGRMVMSDTFYLTGRGSVVTGNPLQAGGGGGVGGMGEDDLNNDGLAGVGNFTEFTEGLKGIPAECIGLPGFAGTNFSNTFGGGGWGSESRGTNPQLLPGSAPVLNGLGGGGVGGGNGTGGNPPVAVPALANTGGGGGGAGVNGTIANSAGGDGGSGVVFIRYPSFFAAATVTGNTPTPPQAGFYVYRWDSGPGSITFN